MIARIVRENENLPNLSASSTKTFPVHSASEGGAPPPLDEGTGNDPSPKA